MQTLDFPPEDFPDLVTIRPAGRSQDIDDAPSPRGPLPACVQKSMQPVQRMDANGLTYAVIVFLVTFPADPNAGYNAGDAGWLDTDAQIVWHQVPGNPSRDRVFNVTDEPLLHTGINIWDVECQAVS